ncbi:type VI secretion system protein IglI family protein [Vibrio spartinae]|uniref:Type VI secretion-associated protein, family n=1 Tax=Vibrio spartinae TaxID=1918945 RepID=A0ABX6QZQ1_9VIBR|nr:type VI secretion system protein IglI family protein [Vibrio spartinae]QMV14485.1 type VI secretion-associated protein, family [Vibrio spartinae]
MNNHNQNQNDLAEDMGEREIYAAVYESLQVPYAYPDDFDQAVLAPIDEHMRVRVLPAVTQTCLTLFSQGCSDIRVICLYLYASDLWLSRAGMCALLPLLAELLTEYRHQLLPQTFTAEAELAEIDLNLALLFKKITRKLGFKLTQSSSTLQQLVDDLDTDTQSAHLEEIEDFTQGLLQHLDGTELSSVMYLKMYQEKITLLDVSPSAAQAPHSAPESESESEGEWEQDIEPASTKSQIGSDLPAQTNSFVQPETSNALAQLLKKMTVFQNLLQQQDYLKAAIIKEDIAHIIENFDPRLYFPALFGPYVQAQISHGEALMEAQMALSQQASIDALNELYHMDLDAFIALELNSFYE